MALTRPTTSHHAALGQLQLHAAPAIGKARCEDFVGATDAAAWLFDGATAGDDPAACRDHDAAWFVNQLSCELTNGLSTQPQDDLRRVLAAAIARLASAHQAICPHAQTGHGPSATAVIVRRRPQALDYLVLGDSALLVETRDGRVNYFSDPRLATVDRSTRQEIRKALENGCGYESPAHHDRLRRLRAAERRLRNRDNGFWIASDDSQAAHHSITGSYSLDGGHIGASRVALTSDGLARAVTHLGVHQDWRELLQALFHEGIPACVARVRQAELDDPAGITHPRTAPSDDAAAITWDLFA
jgi:hypothetical protein